MGILAEFLVATEAEAMAYDGSQEFPETHLAAYKRLTEIELGTLCEITQGKQVSDDTIGQFRVVQVIDDGEQVTYELMPDFVASLASASDDTLNQWAELWAKTEELGCDAQDVLPVLSDLRRLALQARTESKSLYLWNCV